MGAQVDTPAPPDDGVGSEREPPEGDFHQPHAIVATRLPALAGGHLTVTITTNPFDPDSGSSFLLELREARSFDPASVEQAVRARQTPGRSFSALAEDAFADGWSLGYSYTDPRVGTSYWMEGRRRLGAHEVSCSGGAGDEEHMRRLIEVCRRLSIARDGSLRTWVTVPRPQSRARFDFRISVYAQGDRVSEVFARVHEPRGALAGRDPDALPEAVREAEERSCATDVVAETLTAGWALSYTAGCAASSPYQVSVYRILDGEVLHCRGSAANVGQQRGALDACKSVTYRGEITD